MSSVSFGQIKNQNIFFKDVVNIVAVVDSVVVVVVVACEFCQFLADKESKHCL